MKKIISLILTMLFLMGNVAVAEEELKISAPSVILIEAQSGAVLYEKEADIKMPPASVTKVMTMLLVMEAAERGDISFDDMVTCSEYAASMGGSQIFLEPNEQMSVHDMLKAVAVASGNDAAAALAEFVAGSHEGFVSMMNEKAKELGMENTTFINCNGLDAEGHVSTARDISKMSAALLSYPKILDYTSIWMDTLRNGEFGLVNTNKLIRFYDGANGLKTGSTGNAKYCLSASAKRNEMQLIAVVMGAETSKERFAQATKLLDYGFSKYTVAKNLVTEDELGLVKVQKGKQDLLPLYIENGANILVEKARLGKIEKKIMVEESVKAPIKKGEKVGTAEFFLDGRLLTSADILAKNDVLKKNVYDIFKSILFSYFRLNK